MLGVLLETRARRQRRSGGMALSVATHVALIGAVTAATTAKPNVPKPEKPTVIPVVAPTPEAKPPLRRIVTNAPRRGPILPTNFVIKRIDAPTVVPNELPPIDMRGSLAADSIVIGGSRGGTPECGFGCLVGDDPSKSSTSNEWRGSELLMHLITTAKPRYPELLRQAGIDGRVLVRFTVDTLGRIDPTSVQILQTTHEQFSRSVRDALGAFRFRPAEASGRKVPALAEMPFEFKVTR